MLTSFVFSSGKSQVGHSKQGEFTASLSHLGYQLLRVRDEYSELLFHSRLSKDEAPYTNNGAHSN